MKEKKSTCLVESMGMQQFLLKIFPRKIWLDKNLDKKKYSAERIINDMIPLIWTRYLQAPIDVE